MRLTEIKEYMTLEDFIEYDKNMPKFFVKFFLWLMVFRKTLKKIIARRCPLCNRMYPYPEAFCFNHIYPEFIDTEVQTVYVRGEFN